MTTTYVKRSLALPPGNLGSPIIGETISFLRDPHFFDKRHKQYGSIFKTHLFGRPTVVMIGAEANRFLFVNEKEYFSIGWPNSIKALLGSRALVIQTGDIHQKRRKLLSQAFQPRALTGYVSTMESITHTYLDKWERMGTLTWYSELKKYTLHIACKLLLGIDLASNPNLNELFEGWIEGLFSIPMELPWTKFGRAMRCREQLLMQIEEIVLKRQHQPTSDQDTLALLLQAQDEDGNSLSLQELKEQLLMLLFAGHDTLTSALTSLCLLLSQHPKVLASVRAEQQQLGCEEPLTLEYLKQMSYLEKVLKEVLRMIPPAGSAFRQVIKSFEFNGYSIPQGWIALYQVNRTHQDSSVYAQPEHFDPQRFAAERAEDKLKAFSYIPFGGGMRECLGKEFAKLEMKLFATLLTREYEWELLPEQNLDLIMLFTAHPCDGLKVKFRRLVRNTD